MTPPSLAETRWRSRRVVLPGGEQPAIVVARAGVIHAIEPFDARAEVTHDLGDIALLPGVSYTFVIASRPRSAAMMISIVDR